MSADAVSAADDADAPIATTERIAALDVLRGFALLGIFIMNMPGFSHSQFAMPAPLGAIDGLAELETSALRFERLAVVERDLERERLRRRRDREQLAAMADDALGHLDDQLAALDRSRLGRIARGAVAARQVAGRVERTGEGPLDLPRTILAQRREAIRDRAERVDPDDADEF